MASGCASRSFRLAAASFRMSISPSSGNIFVITLFAVRRSRQLFSKTVYWIRPPFERNRIEFSMTERMSLPSRCLSSSGAGNDRDDLRDRSGPLFGQLCAARQRKEGNTHGKRNQMSPAVNAAMGSDRISTLQALGRRVAVGPHQLTPLTHEAPSTLMNSLVPFRPVRRNQKGPPSGSTRS